MASLAVIFKLSLATIFENRLRSVLTLIGMIFGNAAVIATLSSNDGAKVFIAKQLESLGNKLMTVELAGRSFEKVDLQAIEHFADEIDQAAIEQNIGQGQIRFHDRITDSQIQMGDHRYFSAVNLHLADGRLFTNQESGSLEPVAMLGYRVKTELFRTEHFVNEHVSITMGSEPMVFRVIGSFQEKGGITGSSLDSSIYIPPALGRKLSHKSDGRLVLVLKDDNRATVAKYQLQSLFAPKYKSDLKITDAREAIERTKAIWGRQNLVGICLAAISLLTGGVGIMNIMLLSIHQRQKEIGLRKAVGAQNSEIAIQFLMETIIICLLGAILGVVVGWGFGRQVAKMMGNWEASMSVVSVLVAMAVSVLTGVIFGAMPAMRAARIDPYDALRTG